MFGVQVVPGTLAGMGSMVITRPLVARRSRRCEDETFSMLTSTTLYEDRIKSCLAGNRQMNILKCLILFQVIYQKSV